MTRQSTNFRSCTSAVREAERKCCVHFGRPAKAEGADCFATFACSEIWATHRAALSCCRLDEELGSHDAESNFPDHKFGLAPIQCPIPAPGTNGHEQRCGRRSVFTIYPQIKVGYWAMEISFEPKSASPEGNNMPQTKTVVRWAHKLAMRSLLLVGATTLVALALVPTVNAQIAISITPPVCVYGYYGYAPYGCAPSGYYGPGYFYGGVFLGVGPWANWGYGHGWGEHRFSGGRGGVYVEGRGNGGRGYADNHGRGPAVERASHSSASARNSRAAHADSSHAAAGHGHGGERHD